MWSKRLSVAVAAAIISVAVGAMLVAHVLQLRQGASDTPRDASNGSGHYGSCVVDL
jgi:hypothetical protein